MRIVPGIFALCFLTMFSGMTGAAEPLSGDAVRKAFRGNTVSGRYMNGQLFTEYHHPDGRVLGHNGWQANTDACWTTNENNVCYYYGPPERRTTHCFTVELIDRLYILRIVENDRVNAVATVKPENPRNHTDNGADWSCSNTSQIPDRLRQYAKLITPRPVKSPP